MTRWEDPNGRQYGAGMARRARLRQQPRRNAGQALAPNGQGGACS